MTGQGRRKPAESSTEPASRFERQRERILDAATTLLNRKGVRGMTLLEVAQALDLTTTSVTYYFRYKEQLAAAVFEESLDRLAALVAQAGQEPTPRARVARYIELYFDHAARALLGEARPMAILSEIRALEEETRRRLIGQYQGVFRAVRAFFGEEGGEARKRITTARTQLLNEALFWSVIWLPHYAIGDFANVRRRLFAILDGGLAIPGTAWDRPLVDLKAPSIRPVGRSAFLRVATRLINDIGYKGASIDRIVGELNVTKGSFYHHLDAKDDLVLACSRDSYRRLARVQALVNRRHQGVWPRLASGIASALAVQLDGTYPFLRSTALQAMPAAVKDGAVEQGNRTALWIAGTLVDAMAEGAVRVVDPLIAGHLVMSTINSAYDMRSWTRGQTREEAVRLYAGMLMDGIFDPD